MGDVCVCVRGCVCASVSGVCVCVSGVYVHVCVLCVHVLWYVGNHVRVCTCVLRITKYLFIANSIM